MNIPFLDLKAINAPLLLEITPAVNRCLASGWFVLGQEVANFENQFATYCGVPHAIGVANGLDAITLLLKAYEFPLGTEIIVPANTYIATILGIINAGLKPILVEPDQASFLLDATAIEQAITPQTKAILLVELYGKSPQLDKIASLAKKHNLLLFSDNAQSHGATFQGKPTPIWLDAATYSFYPTKNLGCFGDGGAVVTKHDTIAQRIKILRNYGSEIKYQFDYQGVNSRLDELQAAILSVKLQHLPAQLKRRRQLATYYLNNIKNPTIVLPPADTPEEDAWHLFVIRCLKRDELRTHLAAEGIGTDVHYPIPPHKQKALIEWRNSYFPITEAIHQQVVSIPLHQGLTDAAAAHIVHAINKFQPLC